jgi:hypothetical protein
VIYLYLDRLQNRLFGKKEHAATAPVAPLAAPVIAAGNAPVASHDDNPRGSRRCGDHGVVRYW